MGTIAENQKTCIACKYREVGLCSVDQKPIHLHVQDNDCPKDFYVLGVPEKRKSSKETVGSILWKKYHLRALNWDGKNPEEEEKFRNHLADHLANCPCKAKWDKRVKDIPFDPKRYFSLTVEDHDYVNKDLGKEEYGIARALELYSSFKETE